MIATHGRVRLNERLGTPSNWKPPEPAECLDFGMMKRGRMNTWPDLKGKTWSYGPQPGGADVEYLFDVARIWKEWMCGGP